MVVSIFDNATMEARRMVAEEVVNTGALPCGRGVTLRKDQRQGVTPCESPAEAAKGDLCIRSSSPSWLAVHAPAEAAKGDLCIRSSNLSWLAVRAFFFLCSSKGTHDEVFLKIATV